VSKATRVTDWDRKDRQWVKLAHDGDGESTFHRDATAPPGVPQQLDWNGDNPDFASGLALDQFPQQTEHGLPRRIVVSVLLGSTGEWPERLEAPEGETAPAYDAGLVAKFWYAQH
jgi:hypothetical protein